MLFHKSLSAILSVSLVIPLFAAEYSDVPKDIWYEQAVQSLTAQGFLDISKTTFRPGASATRAEFVKLIVEMNGDVLGKLSTQTFDDVPKSAWYYSYMEEAAKESWVRGEKNCAGVRPCRVYPESGITRAEAAMLIVRSFALQKTATAPAFPDNPSDRWYTDAVQISGDHCLFRGDDRTGNVRPLDTISRAEMAVLLYRIKESAGCTETGNDAAAQSSAAISSVPAASSSTSVSRNALTVTLEDPVAYPTIRRGQKNMEMIALRFVASCNDAVRIDGMVVRHAGTGTALDLTGVYAFANDRIITDGQPDEKKREWTMRFDPPLIVEACTSGDLSYVVDISDKAQPNSFHALAIGGAEDIDASTDDIAGVFPLYGPMIEVR